MFEENFQNKANFCRVRSELPFFLDVFEVNYNFFSLVRSELRFCTHVNVHREEKVNFVFHDTRVNFDFQGADFRSSRQPPAEQENHNGISHKSMWIRDVVAQRTSNRAMAALGQGRRGSWTPSDPSA